MNTKFLLSTVSVRFYRKCTYLPQVGTYLPQVGTYLPQVGTYIYRK